tara:strand:+ start:300 stop:677 length:378 start_codon:yes stop_codon:yes gene_type:complete
MCSNKVAKMLLSAEEYKNFIYVKKIMIDINVEIVSGNIVTYKNYVENDGEDEIIHVQDIDVRTWHHPEDHMKSKPIIQIFDIKNASHDYDGFTIISDFRSKNNIKEILSHFIYYESHEGKSLCLD